MAWLRSASRLFVGVGALVVLVGLVEAARADDPSQPKAVTVVEIEKADEGEALYFAVVMDRPNDMKVKWEWRDQWFESRGQQPVDIAELYAMPAWMCPVYAEGVPTHYQKTPNALNFVGRCRRQDSIDLQLRYAAKNGDWNEVPVHLNLAGVAKTADVEVLKRRWARAQAEWFARFRRYADDSGGFLAYAQQQTRRQYGLEASREAAFRDRPTLSSGDELLFDVTTGALAVQESLQLDRMTNAPVQREERTVPIKDIKTVQVKSHPFDKMRGDKEPVFSDPARLVPADNYYLRFNTLNKLRELLDFANDWGPSLLRLAEPVGADYDLDTRIRRQLCLPDTIRARLLGPAVIKELAITGSDPYVREGADITILFKVRAREVFQQAVDQHFREAALQNKDAVEGSEIYRDITVQRLVSPRRTVSCFRCWLGDVCVYGNSLAGIKRVIDVHTKNRPSLAEAPDFRYMRAAVFPFDDKTEDGFLYLSDEFIRRLVGPELRIKEKRRLQAVTSLKLLENAVLFYGYQFGPSRPTMDELIATFSLRPEDLYDSEGGGFSWDPDLGMARSTTYGDVSFLTPLVEIEADRATAVEQAQYDEFRKRYQSYWREYFDPIGVRIKVDRTIRLELCILPLIDSSAYNDFEDLAGGKPISIDLGTFGKDTLVRVMGHLKAGRHKRQISELGTSFAPNTNIAMDWLGGWFSFWVEDSDGLLSLLKHQYSDEPAAKDDDEAFYDGITDIFGASGTVGVQIKNPISLVGFLVAIPAVVNLRAGNMVVFNQLEPYKGVTIAQIAPNPDLATWAKLKRRSPSATTQPAASAPTTTGAASQPAISEEPPAIYYASIDDGFYISTQASALRGIIDRLPRNAASQPSTKEAVLANLLVYVAPGGADGARPSVRYFFEQRARRVSLANSARVYLLGRCGMLEGQSADEAARAHYGYRLVCPDGGSYAYDPQSNAARCSLHGSVYHPTPVTSPAPGSPVLKLLESVDRVIGYLRFTPEGLETTLEIRRR